MQVHDIYICAVWLTKQDRRDQDTVKFWSQVLNCSSGILNNAIKQAQRCKIDLPKDPCTNDSVQYVWDELKDFSVTECKLLLKRSRREPNG